MEYIDNEDSDTNSSPLDNDTNQDTIDKDLGSHDISSIIKTFSFKNFCVDALTKAMRSVPNVLGVR